MKTTHLSVLLTLALTLSELYPIYGQNNSNVNNTQANIAVSREKANEANIPAGKAYNSTSLTDLKQYGKEASILLDEVKKAIDNAQTNLSGISIPADNSDYQKFIKDISNEIIGLEHEINYTLEQVHKMNQLRDFEEAKYIALDIMEELKKIVTSTYDVDSLFWKAKQSLVKVD